MTNEEAIEYLSKRYIAMSTCLTLDECRKHNKAISMAIEALEKQIPKKPYWEYGGCHCKSCGLDVLSDEHFCPLCGQAIDWEVSE